MIYPKTNVSKLGTNELCSNETCIKRKKKLQTFSMVCYPCLNVECKGPVTPEIKQRLTRGYVVPL